MEIQKAILFLCLYFIAYLIDRGDQALCSPNSYYLDKNYFESPSVKLLRHLRNIKEGLLEKDSENSSAGSALRKDKRSCLPYFDIFKARKNSAKNKLHKIRKPWDKDWSNVYNLPHTAAGSKDINNWLKEYQEFAPTERSNDPLNELDFQAEKRLKTKNTFKRQLEGSRPLKSSQVGFCPLGAMFGQNKRTTAKPLRPWANFCFARKPDATAYFTQRPWFCPSQECNLNSPLLWTTNAPVTLSTECSSTEAATTFTVCPQLLQTIKIILPVDLLAENKKLSTSPSARTSSTVMIGTTQQSGPSRVTVQSGTNPTTQMYPTKANGTSKQTSSTCALTTKTTVPTSTFSTETYRPTEPVEKINTTISTTQKQENTTATSKPKSPQLTSSPKHILESIKALVSKNKVNNTIQQKTGNITNDNLKSTNVFKRSVHVDFFPLGSKNKITTPKYLQVIQRSPYYNLTSLLPAKKHKRGRIKMVLSCDDETSKIPDQNGATKAFSKKNLTSQTLVEMRKAHLETSSKTLGTYTTESFQSRLKTHRTDNPQSKFIEEVKTSQNTLIRNQDQESSDFIFASKKIKKPPMINQEQLKNNDWKTLFRKKFERSKGTNRLDKSNNVYVSPDILRKRTDSQSPEMKESSGDSSLSEDMDDRKHLWDVSHIHKGITGIGDISEYYSRNSNKIDPSRKLAGKNNLSANNGDSTADEEFANTNRMSVANGPTQEFSNNKSKKNSVGKMNLLKERRKHKLTNKLSNGKNIMNKLQSSEFSSSNKDSNKQFSRPNITDIIAKVNKGPFTMKQNKSKSISKKILRANLSDKTFDSLLNPIEEKELSIPNKQRITPGSAESKDCNKTFDFKENGESVENISDKNKNLNEEALTLTNEDRIKEMNKHTNVVEQTEQTTSSIDNELNKQNLNTQRKRKKGRKNFEKNKNIKNHSSAKELNIRHHHKKRINKTSDDYSAFQTEVFFQPERKRRNVSYIENIPNNPYYGAVLMVIPPSIKQEGILKNYSNPQQSIRPRSILGQLLPCCIGRSPKQKENDKKPWEQPWKLKQDKFALYGVQTAQPLDAFNSDLLIVPTARSKVLSSENSPAGALENVQELCPSCGKKKGILDLEVSKQPDTLDLSDLNLNSALRTRTLATSVTTPNSDLNKSSEEESVMNHFSAYVLNYTKDLDEDSSDEVYSEYKKGGPFVKSLHLIEKNIGTPKYYMEIPDNLGKLIKQSAEKITNSNYPLQSKPINSPFFESKLKDLPASPTTTTTSTPIDNQNQNNRTKSEPLFMYLQPYEINKHKVYFPLSDLTKYLGSKAVTNNSLVSTIKANDLAVDSSAVSHRNKPIDIEYPKGIFSGTPIPFALIPAYLPLQSDSKLDIQSADEIIRKSMSGKSGINEKPLLTSPILNSSNALTALNEENVKAYNNVPANGEIISKHVSPMKEKYLNSSLKNLQHMFFTESPLDNTGQPSQLPYLVIMRDSGDDAPYIEFIKSPDDDKRLRAVQNLNGKQIISQSKGKEQNFLNDIILRSQLNKSNEEWNQDHVI